MLWPDNEKAATDAIQLEYSYVRYDEVATAKGSYDWSKVDSILDAVASRGHQAILRFYFVYPGKPSSVPGFIKQLPDYLDVTSSREGNPTGFVDWSHPAMEPFTLDFYTAFANRYDKDPRLAYLQTGFGLWSEYHIYDGPRKLGESFPSKSFQEKFLTHLASIFTHTPWMISIDAADGDYSPFEDRPQLLELSFGVFDDSFLCKQHAKENAKNWEFMGRDRWKHSPGGGEFSYYNEQDQRLALSLNGPNRRSIEDMGAQFHVSFMIGNDQPRYQTMQRIASAGRSMGYRITLSDCQTDGSSWRVTATNDGIAPMYHDAYVTIEGKRSGQSLKGLLPNTSVVCELTGVKLESTKPEITIQSDRLVKGQTIPFAVKPE